MWISHPIPDHSPPPIPILRAPAGKELRVLLRGEARRLFLHFAAGRTWPCVEGRCSLCKRGVARRVYAYYPCYTRSMSPAVLELTGQAEGALLAQMAAETDIPRGVVQVSRSPVRRNSPVEVVWSAEPAEHAGLPDALSPAALENALLRVWELPPRNGEADEAEWLARVAAEVERRTSPRPGK
jgi:hypothetical protein